jgi:hypothetical protein
VTSDGAGQSVTGTAFDVAGNSASASLSPLNVDTVAPDVSGLGVADGAVYPVGAVPAARCAASDSLSGLRAPCTVAVTGGLPNGVGSFVATATAVDTAGNRAVATASYSVIYGFGGFLQPVNDTAHQVGVATSVFKAGSTVPLKLQLTNASGAPVAANTPPVFLTPAKGSSTNAAVDEALYGDAVTSGTSYKWDSASRQYSYNWGTAKTAANYYWRVGVRLDDGQTYVVNIGLR